MTLRKATILPRCALDWGLAGFPDRPIVDLETEHLIFRVHYAVDQRVQIPSINYLLYAMTH